MKMKTTKALGRLLAVSLSVVALGFGLSSCSKKEDVKITATPQYSAHPITANTTNLSGVLRGTMLTSVGAYTITGDVKVNPGDTLFIQKGVTVTITSAGTAQGQPAILVGGVIISEGTKEAPITFTASTAVQGAWGGIISDTAQYVRFNWTHLNYTGNKGSNGKARKTITMTKADSLIITDCWIQSGGDDGIRASGGAKVSILRNTIFGQGTDDGEAINLKTGAVGNVAYNVIGWGAGNGIKVETSQDSKFPQTDVTVYNNTVVNSGYRRGAGEPGVGTSFGAYAKGKIYNNLYVNCYNGLNIDGSADNYADTTSLKGNYGYNFFYATRDSVKPLYYVPGSWGKKQSTDITDVDPKFVNYSSTFNDNDLMPPAGYDYHLQSGSPALGKGNTAYNKDIGAYTTDGKGNQH